MTPLHTLLAESGRENDIVLMIITDREGPVIAQTTNATDVDTVRSGPADTFK